MRPDSEWAKAQRVHFLAQEAEASFAVREDNLRPSKKQKHSEDEKESFGKDQAEIEAEAEWEDSDDEGLPDDEEDDDQGSFSFMTENYNAPLWRDVEVPIEVKQSDSPTDRTTAIGEIAHSLMALGQDHSYMDVFYGVIFLGKRSWVFRGSLVDHIPEKDFDMQELRSSSAIEAYELFTDSPQNRRQALEYFLRLGEFVHVCMKSKQPDDSLLQERYLHIQKRLLGSALKQEDSGEATVTIGSSAVRLGRVLGKGGLGKPVFAGELAGQEVAVKDVQQEELKILTFAERERMPWSSEHHYVRAES